MLIDENLNKVLSRRDKIEKMLSSGNLNSQDLVKLSTELSELKPIAEQANIVNQLENNLLETEKFLE